MCDRRGSATSSAAGMVHGDLGACGSGMPACNRPMRRHPVGGCGFGRVTVKPLEVSPPAIARIATVRDSHPEAAGLAGGYPLTSSA